MDQCGEVTEEGTTDTTQMQSKMLIGAITNRSWIWNHEQFHYKPNWTQQLRHLLLDVIKIPQHGYPARLPDILLLVIVSPLLQSPFIQSSPLWHRVPKIARLRSGTGNSGNWKGQLRATQNRCTTLTSAVRRMAFSWQAVLQI